MQVTTCQQNSEPTQVGPVHDQPGTALIAQVAKVITPLTSKLSKHAEQVPGWFSGSFTLVYLMHPLFGNLT
jgi:hypothetical protein